MVNTALPKMVPVTKRVIGQSNRPNPGPVKAMKGAQKSHDHNRSMAYSEISQRQVNLHSDKPSTET
jgi:hypothetical protein